MNGKNGEMTLKLNISKAFDRVEMGFLRDIMLKMGFDGRCVSLMVQCVTFVTYAIRLNGKPRGHIVPSRGLRQGHPIFPFIFLFYAKGL